MVTVKDLVSYVVTWSQSGYLNKAASEIIRSKIDTAVFPANIETLRLRAPPSSPHPLQLAIMVNFKFKIDELVVQKFASVLQCMSLVSLQATNLLVSFNFHSIFPLLFSLFSFLCWCGAEM